MKLLSLIIALAIASQISFRTPLSRKIEAYVDTVEADCSDWTKEQWKKSLQEYSVLLDQYKEESGRYSDEEKYMVNKAIGRYNGLLVKYGVEEAGAFLKKLGERVPPFVEGFVEAFKSELQ